MVLTGWDEAGLSEVLTGCDGLVNLAGILNEGAGRAFEQTHVGLVEHATRAAKRAGVTTYLQMSALNADPAAASEYLRSKGRGEAQALAAASPDLRVTLFRPSLIFGPGDHLFNRFAAVLRLWAGPLPLACAGARFAPVHVGDVSEAMLRVLADPGRQGQVYELCGPRVWTLGEMFEWTARRLGRRLRILSLEDRLARLQARIFERLPGRLFTLDNYHSLQVDSLCGTDGLARLGIAPADVELVVPPDLGSMPRF